MVVVERVPVVIIILVFQLSGLCHVDVYYGLFLRNSSDGIEADGGGVGLLRELSVPSEVGSMRTALFRQAILVDILEGLHQCDDVAAAISLSTDKLRAGIGASRVDIVRVNR